MKIDEAALERMKLFLDYAARKQKTIASNLANSETPGYRAQDVKFEDVLRDAVGAPGELKKTSERHLEARPVLARPGPSIDGKEDTLGYDGNNVDLEKEMTELAENVLRFSVVSRLVQQKLQMIRSGIKEGRTQ